MQFKRLAGLAIGATVALATGLSAWANQVSGPQTLVIGVDHVDPANQVDTGPGLVPGRVFEYTDFFSRDVSVHSGDTLNFRAAPFSFHIVALAANEAQARQIYPIAFNDEENAAGSGAPRIRLGPSNFPITGGSVTHPQTAVIDFSRFNGPPDCGTSGAPVCHFTGPDDIEVAGPNPGFGPSGPAPADWNIQIDAPVGTYSFFCYIHPGMRGKLHVVDPGRPTTPQTQINGLSVAQFAQDRQEALAAEKAANVVRFTTDAAGKKEFQVQVGAVSANGKVAIDEMFPRQALQLAVGDSVKYLWLDPHNVHSVVFPGEIPGGPELPPPFTSDCGSPDVLIAPPGGPKQPPSCGDPGQPPQVEFIVDPGTARPGVLSDQSVVDSGVLAGTGYGITTVQDWSAVASQPGTYHFQCTIHDWMRGSLNVS